MIKLAVLSLALSLASASAATLYNESVSGDLSNLGTSPTSLTFGLGSNQVLGATGRLTAVDRDYLTFTIAPGQLLTSITVLSGTSVGAAVSFIGLQAGNQVTVASNAATAAGLLGWWHYSAADIGTDILDDMGVANNGSSGFAPPLGAGDYAVWIQEFSSGSFSYAFDFNVQTVPEPSTTLSAAFALAVLLQARRKVRLFRPSGTQKSN